MTTMALDHERQVLARIEAVMAEMDEIIAGADPRSMSGLTAARYSLRTAHMHMRTRVERAERTSTLMATFKGRHVWNDRGICTNCGVSVGMANHMGWKGCAK